MCLSVCQEVLKTLNGQANPRSKKRLFSFFKQSKLQRRENVAGYLFIMPMLLGVSLFTVMPIVASLLLSFTEWNFLFGFKKIQFIGFDNFSRLFSDPVFWQSFVNNLIFILIVPITMAISLCLAIILNKGVYFKDFFKVIYFMPYISSIVAVAMVWQVLFHPSYGPINSFLQAIGIDNPPSWLADVHFALPSVMIIMIWTSIGFNLIIYIAGLQSIPKDLYEAAEIDGANTWKKFRYVTFPMLSPTTFFLLITGVISSFKVFDVIKVLTEGGPAGSTSVVVYYLYDTAFVNLDMGYASAMALVLFVAILCVTAIQWFGQRKWVNY